ncbi:hypothetical protein [Parablautia muri]|uniref:Uncharacterized protein n=1 Tax=Parablautia muri TaxID=2320879 RepID=A0A9X5BJ91_9FIRM|nr:hypothetical protein [Parablautia muri]NBJ94724.1 hypothetical protein [Parablautia muri]
MEIQNNYNAFSDRRYQESHTHHITKCLHEEESAKSKSMAAGMKQDAVSLGEDGKTEPDSLFTYGAVGGREKKTGGLGLKKGLDIIKGIWDSMGDEEKTKAASEKGLIAGSETVEEAGIDAASSAIKQGLPYRIVKKWESVRERLKAGLSTALKRFNKGDAFGALTDPKGNFGGKKGSGRQGLEKAGRGTRQRRPDILTASLSESHLMDSYSKSGEYCQINENLTYHRSKAAEK